VVVVEETKCGMVNAFEVVVGREDKVCAKPKYRRERQQASETTLNAIWHVFSCAKIESRGSTCNKGKPSVLAACFDGAFAAPLGSLIL
jgi:hypothetical protein